MSTFRIADSQALAVHAFLRAEDAAAGTDTPGTDTLDTPGSLPAAARLGRLGELAVAFSPVSRAEYEGPRGEHNLRDLQWLLPRVERHQEVVAALLARGAVLPVRFAPLFSDRAGLEAWLDSRRPAILDALERLRDQEEWGLRLLDAGPPSEMRPDQGPKATGVAYLLAKKHKRDAATSRRQQLDEAGDRIAAELGKTVACLRSLPVRSFDRPLRQAGGDSRSTLRNWALLIHREQLDEARERIDRCSHELGIEGAELEISGPWPPYNFCPSFADPLPSSPGSQPP
ncbi:MAG: GvpL/GvpF family gas vesicle protein [Holophagales bacterium]|nr:GvpL/GvpF family gas vesicle protein [Holophagales bacterium]